MSRMLRPAIKGRQRQEPAGKHVPVAPWLGFLVSASFTPFLGGCMDRRGPRAVIPVGAVAMSAELTLATFVSRPWHLYLTLGVLVSCRSVIVGYTGHSF